MDIEFVSTGKGSMRGLCTDPQGRVREVTLERSDTSEPYAMFIDGIGVSSFEEVTTCKEARAAARRALKREFEDLEEALDGADGEE